MSKLSRAINALYSNGGCSLAVAAADGSLTTYSQQGVRDLMYLLDNEPQRLADAVIADKVIGRAAAGIVALAGVRQLYAAVISDKAIPVLEDAGIDYVWGQRVRAIVIPKGDNRCPLEQITANEHSPAEIVAAMRHHWQQLAMPRALAPAPQNQLAMPRALAPAPQNQLAMPRALAQAPQN